MTEEMFITGATGNTGEALLRLISHDESFSRIRITCLCRPGGRGERLLPFRVKIAGGDSSSPESLKKAYQGQGTVIHISSIFHAKAVLEGCAGMKRLIAVSSTGVFSKYRDVAGEIEAAEGTIRESGVPYTILRPTMIYGTPEDRNISRLIRLIKRVPIIPLPGGGRAIFQPVHVDDLASCILAALKTDASLGKSYNVPGGSVHSLREIVSIISEVLGRRALIVPVPLGLAEAAAATVGGLSRRPILQKEQIQRLREDKQFDYSEAARDLGYSPMSFREGVSRQIRAIGLG